MFSTVRTNSQIFILTKGANPLLEVGNVVTVSQPRIGQMQQPNQYPLPMVVDIVAQVGNDKRNLNGLPSDKDIFDYMGNMVITANRDLMANELKMLKEQNENIVKSYDHSKELVGIFDGMLLSLNPEEAEKKQNAAKMAALEQTVAQQAEINRQMLAQLQALNEQNTILMNRLDGEITINKKKKPCVDSE